MENNNILLLGVGGLALFFLFGNKKPSNGDSPSESEGLSDSPKIDNSSFADNAVVSGLIWYCFNIMAAWRSFP